MKSENDLLISFFKKVKSNLNYKSIEDAGGKVQEKIPLKPGECFFVFDLNDNKIVYFGGMKKMFGYNNEHIDLSFILDKMHPDDSQLVSHIIENVISQLIHIKVPNYTNVLKLSSRFRNSSGAYMKVLSENIILQTNNDDRVQSILIRYTDISFLDDSDVIDWWVHKDHINKKQIADSIYGIKRHIFTNREKEVVSLILLGNQNSKIAKKLNISEHTVATHRKNILSKSNCSTVQELKLFCKKNGVFD